MTDTYSKYDILKQFRDAKAICISATNKDGGSTKSSAQVETLVLPQPKSCGLKPGSTENKPRTTPFAVRVTEHQKELIRAKAKAANCNVNQYIRLAILGPKVDPERNRNLQELFRELTRQGNNLNQIARQLNANIIDADEGNARLNRLAYDLLEAHKAVRQALSEDQAEA